MSNTQGGPTGRGARWTVVCVVVLAVALGLTACMHWFSSPSVAMLIIGEVRVVGTRGEILLSVANMPDGGLASTAVVVGGMIYDNAKISNVTIEGINGFEVLASLFDDATGDAGFLVAHASAGLPAGDFAKLTFDVTGPVTLAGEFTLTKADISMGDDDNNLIVFELKDAYQYYSK